MGQSKIRNADLAEPINAEHGGLGINANNYEAGTPFWTGTNWIIIPGTPSVFDYTYDTTAGVPSTDGTVTVNGGNVYITNNDRNGSDRSKAIEQLLVGDNIVLSEPDVPGSVKRYRVTAVPVAVVASPNYYTIAATLEATGGTAITNGEIIGVKLDYGASGGGDDTWHEYWKLSSGAITLATSTVYFHTDEEIYALTTEGIFNVLIEEDMTIVGGVARYKRIGGAAPATTNPIVIAASINSGSSYVDVIDNWLLTAWNSDTVFNMPSGNIALSAGDTLSFRWTTPAAWGGSPPTSAVQGIDVNFKKGI